MEWFLLNSGRVEGPFKAFDLQQKLEAGELDARDLACRQGDPHWKALEEFKEQLAIDAKPDDSLKAWILLTENLSLSPSPTQEGPFAQSGPYTTQEVKDLIQSA